MPSSDVWAADLPGACIKQLLPPRIAAFWCSAECLLVALRHSVMQLCQPLSICVTAPLERAQCWQVVSSNSPSPASLYPDSLGPVFSTPLDLAAGCRQAHQGVHPASAVVWHHSNPLKCASQAAQLKHSCPQPEKVKDFMSTQRYLL